MVYKTAGGFLMVNGSGRIVFGLLCVGNGRKTCKCEREKWGSGVFCIRFVEWKKSASFICNLCT